MSQKTLSCLFCSKSIIAGKVKCCEDTFYCSQECQTADWPKHIQTCKRVKPCVLCGKPSTRSCCGIHYCSRECQLKHWPEHITVCKQKSTVSEFPKQCVLCLKPAKLIPCCGLTFYCSKECQHEDWPRHIKTCKRFAEKRLEEARKSVDVYAQEVSPSSKFTPIPGPDDISNFTHRSRHEQSKESWNPVGAYVNIKHLLKQEPSKVQNKEGGYAKWKSPQLPAEFDYVKYIKIKDEQESITHPFTKGEVSYIHIKPVFPFTFDHHIMRAIKSIESYVEKVDQSTSSIKFKGAHLGVLLFVDYIIRAHKYIGTFDVDEELEDLKVEYNMISSIEQNDMDYARKISAINKKIKKKLE